jgi:type I restriction enzyme, S subunit
MKGCIIGWPTQKLKDLGTKAKPAIKAGPFGSSLKKEDHVKEGFKVYGQEQVIKGDANYGDYFIDKNKYLSLKACAVNPGDILISLVGTMGKVLVLPENSMQGVINPRLLRLSLDKEKIIPIFIKFLFEDVNTMKILKRWSQGGTMDVLNAEMVGNLRVPLPPLPEQRAITMMLSNWDSAIEKSERLIVAKQRCLSVFREQLLQKTPQSKRTKLQEVTRESTRRNGERLGRDSIMAVTNKVGMRPMKEETIAPNIERYKVVKPCAFAYNPMRINIGSIAISTFDTDVLVSPDYVVFECDESKLLPGFLNHLRFSRHWKNSFETAGSGSVRVRIYYNDLAVFAFELPPLDVQRRKVSFLDAVQLEIDLLKKQVEAYRQQKRGLMQKLLTGEWQVRVG